MSEYLLKGRGLVKKYKNKEVVKHVDITLEQGKIYGLIGRNGAGKTTLLSMLTAQNPVTEGDVFLNDMPVWENEKALAHLCFSREINTNFNAGLGAIGVKEYLRMAEGYLPHWDKKMAERLVKEFSLDVKQKIGKLSKGMTSMLTIVVAMASKADFTFMDEPVAGLDVVARDQFYRLLLEEYTETGRTFVISTHIIEEAADLFEEVIILNDGALLLKENTQEFLGRCVYVTGRMEEVEAATKGYHVYHKENIGKSMAVTVLLEGGEWIEESEFVTVQPISLQKAFVALCGGEGA